jgi:hypothetical protein
MGPWLITPATIAIIQPFNPLSLPTCFDMILGLIKKLITAVSNMIITNIGKISINILKLLIRLWVILSDRYK